MTKAPQSKVKRFKETARQLGANEDEAAFKEKLGVIARQKPKIPRRNVIGDGVTDDYEALLGSLWS